MKKSKVTIRAEAMIEAELSFTNVEVERGIRYFFVNLDGKYVGQVAWQPHRQGYELDAGVERMLQLPVHGAPHYRHASLMKKYITTQLRTLLQFHLDVSADVAIGCALGVDKDVDKDVDK